MTVPGVIPPETEWHSKKERNTYNDEREHVYLFITSDSECTHARRWRRRRWRVPCTLLQHNHKYETHNERSKRKTNNKITHWKYALVLRMCMVLLESFLASFFFLFSLYSIHIIVEVKLCVHTKNVLLLLRFGFSFNWFLFYLLLFWFFFSSVYSCWRSFELRSCTRKRAAVGHNMVRVCIPSDRIPLHFRLNYSNRTHSFVVILIIDLAHGRLSAFATYMV